MRCEESGKEFESGLVSKYRQQKRRILKQARYRANIRANYCDEHNYTVLSAAKEQSAFKHVQYTK